MNPISQPIKISAEDLRRDVYEFLRKPERTQYDECRRDAIVRALRRRMTCVVPPFTGLLSSREEKLAQDYFAMLDWRRNALSDELVDEAHEAACKDATITLQAFCRYQAAAGINEIFLWSEAWPAEAGCDGEVAYRVPSSLNFSAFISRVGFSVVEDTVLMTPDFAQILIIFHHGWYEFFDVQFAEDFKAFCVRELGFRPCKHPENLS